MTHAATRTARSQVLDRRVDTIGLGVVLLFIAGSVPGWWWGGNGWAGIPILGRYLAAATDPILVFLLHCVAFTLVGALAWTACQAWLAGADIVRGRAPGERFRRHRTPQHSHTAPAPSPQPPPPACWAGRDIPGQPDSPLLAEMTAIHLHLTQLHHLAAQEDQRDHYQHLARIQIRRLLTVWQQQTAGEGTLADLLPQDSTPGQGSAATVSSKHPARTETWYHDCGERAA